MQKKMDGEGNLYDVDVQETEEVTLVTRYSTAAFEIVVKHKEGKDDPVAKLLQRLEQKNKLGGYKIAKEEWKGRKESFIVKRMKPVTAKPVGKDYEESFKAFFKKIFPDG